MLNIRQFIPSDGLLSLFTSLFFLYMKAVVKGTSTHLHQLARKLESLLERLLWPHRLCEGSFWGRV